MSRIVLITNHKNTSNHAAMSCTKKTGHSEDETQTSASHPHKRELKQIVFKKCNFNICVFCWFYCMD